MRIVILDGHTANPGDNPWPQFEAPIELVCYPRTSHEVLLERAAAADILITNKTVLGKDMLEKLPRLKFIAVMATGYNVVDIAAARKLGVPVSNVPAYGTDTVAQYTMALILELCHHIGEHAASVAQGDWASSPDWTYWKSPQIELRGLTLGIVGFGRIGQRVGELAHAFGMNILYSSRKPYPELAFLAQHVPLDTLFREADIVTLHCSLTEDNRGFINKALLETMKPSAFLVNTARGQLIKEQDLEDALRDGVLAGAALDVLSNEPPSSDNPLLRAPGCLVTPHMAWASLAARRRIMQTTQENVMAFLSGTPINVVNT